MASDKIINKILQDANKDAEDTLAKANEDAKAEAKKIQEETQERLNHLEEEFQQDSVTAEKRAKLNAGLDERKNLLAVKRRVMDRAFDEAKRKMRNLPEKEWESLIERIVLAATVTDTEYLKVPRKDMDKYTRPRKGSKMSFLDHLNMRLREIGHLTPLELDRNPAHFEDGVMLIGRYSDVNASFDVLIENMRDQLEYDVTEILFGAEE